jgi:hypothetical protein
VAIALCFSCSGGDGGNDSGLVHLDGPSAPVDTGPTVSKFTVYDVPGCGQAGYQTAVAAAGSKVAFATLATTGKDGPCPLEDRPTATGPLYDICFVQPSGDAFVGSVVTTQVHVAPTGVGLAMDQAGEPVLAYTGGAIANAYCSASDMMIANVVGGALANPRTIAVDSQSTGMPADQAVNCAAQDVCNRGDVTDLWPSIALDPASG